MPSDINSLLQAAAKLVVVLVSALVAVVYYSRIRDDADHPNVARLALGIFLVATGYALNQSYWIVARIFAADGQTAVEMRMMEWGWVTLFPLAIVVVGNANHLEPVLRPVFGRRWLIGFLAATLSLFMLIVSILEAMLL